MGFGHPNSWDVSLQHLKTTTHLTCKNNALSRGSQPFACNIHKVFYSNVLLRWRRGTFREGLGIISSTCWGYSQTSHDCRTKMMIFALRIFFLNCFLRVPVAAFFVIFVVACDLVPVNQQLSSMTVGWWTIRWNYQIPRLLCKIATQEEP